MNLSTVRLSSARLAWTSIAVTFSVGAFVATGACSSDDASTSAASATVASSSTAASSGGSSSNGGGGAATTSSSTSAGGSATGGAGGMGGGAPGVVWMAGPSLATARTSHTATRLADGRVLVVGGQSLAGQPLGSTEIFDPAANTWSSGPPLATARENHAAVLLSDGEVIVIGGGKNTSMGIPSGMGVVDSTELFDPTSNTFSPGPTLVHGRGHHGAKLLADGRVLVAGGVAMGGASVLEAEALSQDHMTFAAVGSLAEGHALFGLVLRPGGDVVALGGLSGNSATNKAEVFDPSTNMWSPLPSMSDPRLYVAAAPLADGRVLAAGGIDNSGDFLTTTEILAGDKSAWSAGPEMKIDTDSVVGGSGVNLVVLEDGKVLAAGAYGQDLTLYGPGSYSGIFDPVSNQWTQVSSLDSARGLCAAVELADHRVMLTGGIGPQNGPTATTSISAAPVE